ncbi:DUF6401 family natural product biosynthesis protein [Allostreptomyces psammosilenae]|uniref:Uncharacterized protein n=1 Tax=Allostreptomyces psammosilenae TaxID=1892865 RepID=A0A853A3I8_9ACTN|nr:DUF6401 family natural product biosynthesis protein [Allostreptomyces psammosilenae]NYI05048.1 hypothetical protein [Allostreptomyces psammosilenae]
MFMEEFSAGGQAPDPLRWAMEEFGHRLAHMPYDPALVAAVDQHAAEVRDAIELGRETLGDYLLGFVDGLREQGWEPYTAPDPFAMLRLSAVCWLAREHGFLADETSA